MGCRILVGRKWNSSTEQYEQTGACFYESVTDTVFGRLMQSEAEAEAFLEWFAASHTLDIMMYSSEEIASFQDDFVQTNVCECGNLRDKDTEPEPAVWDDRYMCVTCTEKNLKHIERSKAIAKRFREKKLKRRKKLNK